MNISEAAERILRKMAARHRFGLFDWSAGSYDREVALTRAYRIHQRLQGRRISFRQAMRGE